MQPNKEFLSLPKNFWANVRTISQEVGYTDRVKRRQGVRGQPGPIKVPTLAEIQAAFEAIDLDSGRLATARQRPTRLGRQVIAYFEYRAHVLNNFVEPQLMDAAQAQTEFEEVHRRFSGRFAVPMKKQSGDMKKPAFFTGIINMLIEQQLGGLPCNYNPQELTTVTRNRQPFRTLARRIDGAFPGPVDPLAVWEIKEYYYTTTFGSRVADGVCETLLDGMELQELESGLREIRPAERGLRFRASARHRPPTIQHLLMVDAYFTW